MADTLPSGNVVTPEPVDPATEAARNAEDVATEAVKNLRVAIEHSKDWRDEARDLYDLVAGKQWSDQDLSLLKERYQGAYPTVVFNVAGKYLDAVQGLQINNRQEIRFYPRTVDRAGLDEYATGVVDWNRDQCNAEDEESDAFRDLALTGMGWVEHFYDDSEDAEGWIAQERRDPIEMYWDPRARRNNLADRQWQIRIKPMSPDSYREQFGEDPPSMEGRSNGIMGEDSTPQIIIEPHDYGTSTGGTNMPTMIYVIDYQFWKLEDAVHVKADFGKGLEQKTFDPQRWQQLKQPMTQAAVKFEETPLKIKRYYRALIAGGKVKGEVNRLKHDGFTFECMTGKRDRNANTWFGIGRAMMDPNKWVNKFFSSILFSVMTNAKGGLMAEEGVFENDAKAEASWANPSAITKVTPGSISGNRIQPKPQSPYPQGMDKLMMFSLDALPLTTGLNPEILGLANREQAGILESQRKQAALAIISWAFDAMKRYHKRAGKLMLDMSRLYLPENRLIRIDTKGGQQYIPLLRDKLNAQFDIIVDEAPTSVNMQERTWNFLKEILPLAEQMGVPIPPSVLQYAPIPSQLSAEWQKLLQPDPKAQELQNRSKEAEVAQMEAKAKLDNSRAGESDLRPQLEHMAQQLEDARAQWDQKAELLKTAHQETTRKQIAEEQRKSDEKIATLEASIEILKLGVQSQQQSVKQQAEAATRESDTRAQQAELRADDALRQVETLQSNLQALLQSQQDTFSMLAKPRKRTAVRDKDGRIISTIDEVLN